MNVRTEQLPGYGLERPTVPMVLASLERYVDEDEVWPLWHHACRLADVDHTADPDLDELLRAVEALQQCGELPATCAKGLRIRIMSYVVLSRANVSSTAPVGV